MKISIAIQSFVLIGLLFIAGFCLSFQKPEQFSELKSTELYAQCIRKIENQPSAESKEVVNIIRTLSESQLACLNANESTSRFIHTSGYMLLWLALVQFGAILVSLGKK